MKPIYLRIASPDVEDLKTYIPEKGDDLFLFIQMFVTHDESDGEESFDFVLCDPASLSKKLLQEDFVIGEHYIFTKSYDYKKLQHFLISQLSAIKGDSWEDLALKIDRIGMWEFRDYKNKIL